MVFATITDSLENDPAFVAVVLDLPMTSAGRLTGISELHRAWGGEQTTSLPHFARIVHRIHKSAQPPTTAAATEPKPEPPKIGTQLRNAIVAPPVASAGQSEREQHLERENAILREQLRWSQRADVGTHTGGKLTIVISDVHLGDRSHMPRCYDAMWQKTLVHAEGFAPDEILVIDNGDHIAGRGIYRNQNMDAVLQTTEDQVKIGAVDIMQRDKALKERFPDATVTWRLTHGNHDMSMGERTSPMLVLMARMLGTAIVYCGDATIVNLAAAGTYNLYAEHGFGYSGISPSSPKWLDAMKDKLLLLARSHTGDARIRRVTHGHTHYATSSIERILDYFFDTTGGCQRNERVLLGKNSRPMGFLAYASPAGHDGILQPQLIQPDTEMQIDENADAMLFQRNMEQASAMLTTYNREAAARGVVDLIEPEGR